MRKILGALVVVSLGCGQGELNLGQVDELTGQEKQKEAWSNADNPSLFSGELDFTLDALPMTGEAANIPWAGSYWPTYEDNINHLWDGAQSDSAAKKYELAFGGTGVEDAVSRYHGIDSVSSAKTCTQSSECRSSLGETCAMRRGATTGRCIATWWGICHAWGPASILLPEPKHPVTKNGVTFKVQDLKALGTLIYNRTQTKFVSLRCNKNNGEGEIAFDNYGRPSATNSECRDTNPGTWHVLMANYLGRMRQAFVEDRTFDYQVWNQPLRGYEVVEKREVTAAEANELIGATSEGGTTQTAKGTLPKNEWFYFGPFTVEAGKKVTVLMNGTGDADLYVKFGEKPSTSSSDCSSTGSTSSEHCELTAATASDVYVAVLGYADSSGYDLSVTVGGSVPQNYLFNPKAVRFAFIRANVKYITEAAAETDGNLSGQIDRYTRSDRYSYVLELDGEGKIIGGEWTGSSKTNHPDFVWLPLAPSGTSVAGGKISVAEVKALIDLSVAEPGSGTEKTFEAQGELARREFKVFGPFNVAEGTKLAATITGTGDADLYARKGGEPTLTTYDCRPYKGGSNESCEAAGPGMVYVGVNGYAAKSTFQLRVTYREP